MERNIEIPVGEVVLPGILTVPVGAKSLVVFAHGSGSTRFSPRNKSVSVQLQKMGMATLLFDLLTEEEDLIYQNRFEIDLIAGRLETVTKWLSKNSETSELKIGYFGASTGAAAALQAAAHLPELVGAVVSRGGRGDLAESSLNLVKAPTLLIVGGADEQVIKLNQKALDQMHCVSELKIIPGAGHLFEEGNSLFEVGQLAAQWFQKYLG